jgi:ParB family transcriptional regulator, chromosome partitioning protein
MSEEQIQHVPLDELVPFVHQSRTVFDEDDLRNLAEDIKANGQLQPGVAWLDPGRGNYLLICGERRWRAIRAAGKATMAVKVIPGNLTQGQMLAINLSENLQRENLNPVERALSFQRLAQLEGLTSTQVAERMHVSNATVSRDLAMLELPEPVLTLVARGTLAASVAYELTKMKDSQARSELLRTIIAEGMNRDQAAAAVRKSRGDARERPPSGSRLACKLDGVSVTVTGNQPLTRGHIQLVIDKLRQAAKQLPDRPVPAAARGESILPS